MFAYGLGNVAYLIDWFVRSEIHLVILKFAETSLRYIQEVVAPLESGESVSEAALRTSPSKADRALRVSWR